jgi:hypothetical protein
MTTSNRRAALRLRWRVELGGVGQSAVVDGDGLGDLEEANWLEPVEALGRGLVAVRLGQPRADGGVGRVIASVWAHRKQPRPACILVSVEDAMSPASPRSRAESPRLSGVGVMRVR